MEVLSCYALDGFPDVGPGTDIGAAVCACLKESRFPPATGDVLVLAHKVVSKAEGATVDLERVVPGGDAEALAARTGKDPRLCQVILDESRRVLRSRRDLVIAEHRLGWICANAGVDLSNADREGRVVLLPADPDASARRVRDAVRFHFDVEVGVIVDDTQGRPHREGIVGVCVGLAGMEALRSWVGRTDRRGYELRASVEAVADELAAAATLLQGQADEGRPLVVIRGAEPIRGRGGAGALLRAVGKDLFR